MSLVEYKGPNKRSSMMIRNAFGRMVYIEFLKTAGTPKKTTTFCEERGRESLGKLGEQTDK
jgi:hypothetical protein